MLDLSPKPGDLEPIETASRDEIEALQAKLARRLGYRLVNHRLELYGVPLRKSK